jgi:hypothetical protein
MIYGLCHAYETQTQGAREAYCIIILQKEQWRADKYEGTLECA